MNSRAVTKMCWKWRETECQTAVSGQVFPLLRVRRTCKRKTATVVCQERHGHRSTGQGICPLCSHGYGVGIAHPAPAGVASLCERMRYRYSPITTLRGYRYKRPPFWRWHFISFWWSGRTSAQCRTPD